MAERHQQEIDIEKLLEADRNNTVTQSVIESKKGKYEVYLSESIRFSDQTRKIIDHLSHAEQHAVVGSELLPMSRFPLSIRWIARLVGRIMIYLNEVISVPQRKYNAAMLQSVRCLFDSIMEFREVVERQKEVIEEQKETMRKIKQDEPSMRKGKS